MLVALMTGGAYAQQQPPVSQTPSPQMQSTPLSRDEAVRLALAQASAYQQAQFSEQIAAEDVKQAKAAFLPKITAPLAFIYTTPFVGSPVVGPSGEPSFIAANGVKEYQAFLNVAGDIDLAGRLRAALRRNRLLLEAAHAGTESARRDLIVATDEAYYALAATITKRESAEVNLSAAEQFEHITSLLFDGGEVPQVDLIRARLQTANRRDELEQARAGEQAAANSLRSLIGNSVGDSIITIDLSTVVPDLGEINRFSEAAIARNPGLAQFEAQRLAAEQDAKAARAERRPQLGYSISGGFDTDAIQMPNLKQHSGASAAITLDIPIFDWGASKSRERQAKLRAQTAESQKAVEQRMLAAQFFTARSQALTAAARVQAIRTSIVDAERNAQISIDRYRAGEAQIVEVTESQSTLSAQRAALSQALFDYHVALARLRQVTGQ